ncbi:MAG: hypothetical protein ACREFY_06000, partial [Acetobacteraceae bacterium]
GAGWAWGALAGAWAVRAAAGRGIDLVLRRCRVPLAFPLPLWLLPLRELISLATLLAAFAGSGVEWRGHRLTATRPQDQGSKPR